MPHRITQLASRRRGGTIVIFTLMLVVIIGMAAFAIDIGRMQLVRCQLQTAVDAGAIAGGLHLKRHPNDSEGAKAAAADFIAQNQVGFAGDVPTESIVMETGIWDPDTKSFAPSSTSASALSIHAVQNNEPYFFAGIFGATTFSIPRQSIASAPTTPLDIVMVLDLSSSMGLEGRIQALQDASPVFVDVIDEAEKADRIGVMCYGVRRGTYNPGDHGHTGTLYTGSPSSLFPNPSEASDDWVGVLECPMTSDLPSLEASTLNSSVLTADKYGGGTPIGAAIRDAAHYLEANHRDLDINGDPVRKLMVLMSDGYANKPESHGVGYANQMAEYAASLEITIHTISLGDGADTSLMASVAAATGGQHFPATGTGSELSTQLDQAYRAIADTINRTILVE